MKIGTVMVDWLTMTSFTYGDYVSWRAAVDWKKAKPAHWLQYRGYKDRYAFIGEGEQRGRPHYLCYVSGEGADRAARKWDEWMSVQSGNEKCTRIDFQTTTELPQHWSWERLYHAMRDGDWIGRKRKVSRMDSETGHTVYVGARASDYFIRVYQKLDADGKLYVRFEVEVKGDAAQEEWLRYREGRLSAASTLLRELQALPHCEEIGHLLAAVPVSGEPVGRPARRVAEHDGRVRWLKGQVSPAVEKMLNDHDVASRTAAIVEGWYKLAIKAASRTKG